MLIDNNLKVLVLYSLRTLCNLSKCYWPIFLIIIVASNTEDNK